MFSRLHNLFKFVDATVDTIYQQHADEVQCKPGCADCCHAVFDISFIEAANLAVFLSARQEILEKQHEAAMQAAVAYEQLIKNDKDPAAERIRCPLLGQDNLCLAHSERPINCRTYGTPTIINGQTHVCGLSNFDNQLRYPTIDLAPLQDSLHQYSLDLAGEPVGSRRFPIAWVLLKTGYFLPNT